MSIPPSAPVSADSRPDARGDRGFARVYGVPRARAIRILSLFDLQARADAAVDRKSEPVPPRTDRVVKTTVFLMRGSDFAEVNRICAGYFPNGKFPARTTVVIAGLPHPDFLLEIECEAVLE